MTEPTDMNARIRSAAGYSRGEAEDSAEEVTGHVDFDGGARTSAPGPTTMNTMIRRAAGVVR